MRNETQIDPEQWASSVQLYNTDAYITFNSQYACPPPLPQLQENAKKVTGEPFRALQESWKELQITSYHSARFNESNNPYISYS